MRNNMGHPGFSSLVIVSLLLSGMWMVSSRCSGTMAEPADQESLVGASCSAEFLQTPLVWSWDEQHTATPQKDWSLLLAGFVIILAFLYISPHTTRTLAHGRLHLSVCIALRSGPEPNGTFIPQLFAGHDW